MNSARFRLIPKVVDINPFHGGKSARPGRRGARRDVGHRASAATHPAGRFAPPKAAISRPLTALRPACGGPTPRREPRLVSERDLNGERGQYPRPLVLLQGEG